MKSILAGIVAAILSLFSSTHSGAGSAATPPATQAAAAVASLQLTATTSVVSTNPFDRSTTTIQVATTTVINYYVTHPIVERIVATTSAGVNQTELDAKLNQLENKLTSLVYSWTGAQGRAPASSVPNSVAAGGVSNTIAGTNRIDNLSNTTISNPTITGGSITAASIVGTISNALDAASGAIDALTGTTLTYSAATFTNATTTNATSTNLYAANLSAAALAVSGTSTFSGVNLSGTNCSTYGNGGKLTTDASGNVVCAADQGGSGSTVFGADTQIQFNNGGAFGASANFTFSTSTSKLTVTNASTTNFTASYASSTDLRAGTLALGNALAASSGGTAIANPAAAGVLVGSYAGGGWQQLATSSLGLTTTNVAEGSTNEYFTDARVGSYIAGSSTVPHIGGSAYGDLLSWTGAAWATSATSTLGVSTSDITEGSNLFWSTARGTANFVSNLAATSSVTSITTLSSLASVGTITSGTWNGSFGSVSGANLTNLTPANISTGTAAINITGNAGTATKLATARTINGTLFDGTGNITITAASSTLLNDSNMFSGANTFTALQTFGSASTSRLSVFDTLYVGDSATSTISGSTTGTSTIQGFLDVLGTNSTSTFSGRLAAQYLSVTGTSATSTFASGIKLTSGCIEIGGACVGGSSSQWTTSGSDIYFNSGDVLIGTTTPGRTLTIFNTSANPQQRISYDATRYAEWYEDAAGALNLTTTGKTLNFLNGNIYLCDGGACPSTPVQGYPSSFTTNGNLVAGGTIYAGGFGPATCPSGMIPVPPSPQDGTQGFCVDKYIASNDGSGNEQSVSSAAPWVSIAQYDARAQCIRADKHLITEKEWQAIAHNIEQVASNWSTGVVGVLNGSSQGIPDGLSNYGSSGQSAASAGACSGSVTGNTQNCTTGGGTWYDDMREQALSNGQTIWDFGGNVWEWVDQVNANDYPVYNSPTGGWQACSTSGDGVCGNTLTTNDQWYRGGTTATIGFVRGGDWVNGSHGGAFTLSLGDAPGYTYTSVGFRCAR